jgi:alkanesulfonate monooxygenase SsuD/methylene tetrahydromethanopterin reductase-like flavin-dependent oxidoreductase (luciferase family)
MYLSVFMGPFSRGPAEDLPLIDLCLDLSVAAADAGFCMVTFGEQHFNNYEPYCNPYMMGARLAPFLKDTWFATTITPLPLHQPMRLAEQISILDLLMKGRLIVGMSAGRVGFSPDFQNFGIDPKDREAAFESKLEFMERAWKQEIGDPPIVMDTPWDRGELNGRLMPVAYRAPRPILAVGTNTEATIVTTAKRGFPLFLGPCVPTDAVRKFRLYREALQAEGRDEKTVADLLSKSLVTKHVIVDETDDMAWKRAELMVGKNPMMNRTNDNRSLRELSTVDLTSKAHLDDPNRKNAEHVQGWIVCGRPDTVLRQLRDLKDLGIPHLNTRFTAGGYNPDEIRQSFELFTREVMPKFSAPQYTPLRADEIRAEHRAPVTKPVDDGFRKTWISTSSDTAGPMQTWNLVNKTPFGEQSVTLRFRKTGDGFEGTLTNALGSNSLKSVTLDGVTLRFSGPIVTPMGPMPLTFTGVIDGNTIAGTVQTMFGTNEFRGETA